MSYIRTTFSVPDTSHHYTAEEVKSLSREEFDQLSLANQTYIFNHFREDYDRLTDTTTTPKVEESADESFRKRFTETVDRAISRAFGHTSD